LAKRKHKRSHSITLSHCLFNFDHSLIAYLTLTADIEGTVNLNTV